MPEATLFQHHSCHSIRFHNDRVKPTTGHFFKSSCIFIFSYCEKPNYAASYQIPIEVNGRKNKLYVEILSVTRVKIVELSFKILLLFFKPFDFCFFISFSFLTNLIFHQFFLVHFDISLESCHLLADLFILDVQLLQAFLALVPLSFQS